MYEEKIRPDEMCGISKAVEPIGICAKAKKIREVVMEANGLADRIHGTLYANSTASGQNAKEATCLDDELNDIYEEMQRLREVLVLTTEGLMR